MSVPTCVVPTAVAPNAVVKNLRSALRGAGAVIEACEKGRLPVGLRDLEE